MDLPDGGNDLRDLQNEPPNARHGDARRSQKEHTPEPEMFWQIVRFGILVCAFVAFALSGRAMKSIMQPQSGETIQKKSH